MNVFQKNSFRDKWSPEALAAIGRLDFIAREILDGVQQGLHRSIRRGFSSEFFDYKNYQPGDDASRIDWHLYAKTGKYYIKRFEAETSLECMILADFSPSMRWRWKDTVSKSDYAAFWRRWRCFSHGSGIWWGCTVSERIRKDTFLPAPPPNRRNF